ncbi:hypothetical protein FK178_15260 [Antarcticibacterium arcticum]|uniref:Exodeoxyribonuclease X-like C-terminal domain-containing protein n=1 Tax=Antarcticibacterium arcticum TaxID=2585771 RepID=A0A5B8YNB9_9FLAO|nr:hypothetical protein [Antarcticibacterium arcticum]QED38991.1 hypothetical protein FK178_15260 [Antarcticibacterium arcticum]
MKIYYLDTCFNFGKYEGKTLEEVISIQPDYINWCILNLDHFLVDEDQLEEFLEINTSFFLSKNALMKLEIKWDEYDFNDRSSYGSEETEWANDVQDYDDWLNTEFGDDAGTAYWNMD